LADSDFDGYINDASLSPAQRKLAHQLMALMPPEQRGDFAYLNEDGTILSNNVSLKPCVAVKTGKDGVTASVVKLKPANSIRANNSPKRVALDYSSNCSPPNPASYPGGAYARMVSKCGFTAGWGFVNVPCGETYFANSDVGYLYFEIRGNSGSLVEGGLQYNSDSSVQPYARSAAAGGYVSLNNGGVHYACNQNLVIWHGATLSGTMNFTEVGQLPSSYDPETAWVDEQVISLNNAAWLFYTAPTDYTGGGTDPAGATTPCARGCSASRVTAIAQGEPYNYNLDGSYFGVTTILTSGIQWMQVAFGNWGSDCVNGTTLCTFFSSNSPSVYYGGPQYYPDNSISQSIQSPSGYGPYQSYDSIDETDYGDDSVVRAAAGAFQEPLPPPPCTEDALGYCALLNSSTVLGECNTGITGPHGAPIYLNSTKAIYLVYKAQSQATFTRTTTFSGTHCATNTVIWYPEEPSVMFNDPNLP
jgi:hypothetical protein